MNGTNKKLAIAAAVLLAASIATYWHGSLRAGRFESGQKFLPNLDPDAISTIAIEQNGSTVTLNRSVDEFIVVERHGYRARTSEVNRLLRDLLDIELARRLGRSDAGSPELGLVDGTTVTLKDPSGQVLVEFALGADTEDGGRIVQRLNGDDQSIYSSGAAFEVSSDPDAFVDKEIVDQPASSVVRIQGPDYELTRTREDDGTESGDLSLIGAASKTSEVNRLASFLSRLTFDAVYVADDPEVASLDFDREVRFDLFDQSGYQFEVAETGDQRFVRVRGVFNVDRLEVSQDETDEELEVKARVLERSDEIARFDQYHGSWVYRLGADDAETIDLRVADLRE